MQHGHGVELVSANAPPQAASDHKMAWQQIRWPEWAAVIGGCVIIVGSFCLGGTHATEANYADYFYVSLFAVGYVVTAGACVRFLLRKAS